MDIQLFLLDLIIIIQSLIQYVSFVFTVIIDPFGISQREIYLNNKRFNILKATESNYLTRYIHFIYRNNENPTDDLFLKLNRNELHFILNYHNYGDINIIIKPNKNRGLLNIITKTDIITKRVNIFGYSVDEIIKHIEL